MQNEERIFRVTVKGTSPLLMNKFTDESGNKKTKKEYNDQEEAEKRLYINGGIIYQPAEHFERSMQKAGVNFKYSGRKTYLDFLKSGVFVEPDFIPHKFPKWSVDKKPVNIQKNKIMRSRPIFYEWELDFLYRQKPGMQLITE